MLLLAHLSREDIPAPLHKDLALLLSKGMPMLAELLGMTQNRMAVSRRGGAGAGLGPGRSAANSWACTLQGCKQLGRSAAPSRMPSDRPALAPLACPPRSPATAGSRPPWAASR